MASPINNFDIPHVPPPPPHIIPPPPHIIPPPPPHTIPPPPSPDNHSTVIVIVFVSFGGLFFLAFLAVALYCFLKKRKKVQETDVIHVDEHLKIKEAIVEGPHGQEAVVLSIEDDVHVDEAIRKNEEFGEGMHATSAQNQPKLPTTLEEGPSPSSSSHHHPEHKS